MRAIAINEFGGRERLALLDLPVPETGPDEVLIRVRAAGVGPWDAKVRQGFFGERSFPFVPGFETAGVVEGVGENVEDFSEGDEVYAYRYGGGYAEYLAAPEGMIALKPAALTFEAAAGVPVAGVTAHQGLIDELRVREGETVLITAAAGGVGTFAVQIAAGILGARVIGTASLRNHDHLKEMGATEAIDYNEGDWVAAVREAAPEGVDAVLECVGGETLGRSLEAVRDGGRVAYIVPVDEEPQPTRGIAVHFFSGRPDGGRLAALAAMFDARQLVVHIEDVLPLEEAARAHEHVEAGHTRGKIVLRID